MIQLSKLATTFTQVKRTNDYNINIGGGFSSYAPVLWDNFNNSDFEITDEQTLKNKRHCSSAAISLCVNTDIPDGNVLQSRLIVNTPNKPPTVYVIDSGKTGGMVSLIIPTCIVDVGKDSTINIQVGGNLGGGYSIRASRSFLACQILR